MSPRLRLIPLILIFCAFPSLKSPAGSLSETRRFKAAIAAFQSGSFEKSRALLLQLTNENPGSGLYWFNLGNALFKLEKYAAAAGAYQKVVDVGSPLASAAYLYMSKSGTAMGQLDFAVKILRYLKTQPLTPAVAAAAESDLLAIEGRLEESVSLYRARKYQMALQALDEELRERPSGDAYLLQGMAFLQLGQPDEARKSFEAVARLPDDEETKSEAARFIREIQNGKWKRNDAYWLYVDLSAGYNSNLFGNGASEPRTDSAVFRDRIGVGASLLKKEPYFVTGRYVFTWNEDIGMPSERFLGHSIELPVYFENRQWLLEVMPAFQYQMLGNVPFRMVPGIRARAVRYLRSQQWGFELEMNDEVGFADYNYLSGSSQFAKLYWGYGDEGYLVTLNFSYSALNTGDEPIQGGGVLPLANRSLGPSVGISWHLDPRWQTDASASYLWRNYDNKDIIDGIDRFDKLFVLEAKISYRVNPTAQIYWQSSVILNSSTLGATSVSDENFSQVISYLGVILDVLP